MAIVSYFAPPQPAVASHRVLRLTHTLLAAGHDVHWVTLDASRLIERDETLAALTPAAVVRHGLGGPTLNSLPAARSLFEKILRTLLHKLPDWLALPDKHVEWTFRLRRKLPALAKAAAFDVVVLCCGPHGQILSIEKLRRAMPATRIVVDYRDLLTGNAWTRRGSAGVQRRLQRRERAMLSLADVVFFNSAAALESFRAKVGELPCPVEVMRNAADYGLARQIETNWPPRARGAGGEGCELGFFGTIFPRRRLQPVLNALARLPAATLRTTTLHVWCDPRDSRRLLDEDLATVPEAVRQRVQRHELLAFADALCAMRSMTALVLVNGSEAEDDIFIPGKLYDYLMARRPILFIGNPCDAWRIVQTATGAGRCFSHGEAEALARSIAELQHRPADLEPAAEFGCENTFAPLLQRLQAWAGMARPPQPATNPGGGNGGDKPSGGKPSGGKPSGGKPSGGKPSGGN